MISSRANGIIRAFSMFSDSARVEINCNDISQDEAQGSLLTLLKTSLILAQSARTRKSASLAPSSTFLSFTSSRQQLKIFFHFFFRLQLTPRCCRGISIMSVAEAKRNSRKKLLISCLFHGK